MKIRFAQKKDCREVLGLLDELLTHGYQKLGKAYEKPNEENDQKRRELFEEELGRKDMKIFVVEDKGKLNAECEFTIKPLLRRGYYIGEIETFVVSEGLRGKGIGSM